jgi:hypothetical protein
MSEGPPEIPRHINLPPIRLDAQVAVNWWRESFQPGQTPPSTEAAVNAMVAYLRTIPRYSPLFERIFPNGQKVCSARYIEFVENKDRQGNPVYSSPRLNFRTRGQYPYVDTRGNPVLSSDVVTSVYRFYRPYARPRPIGIGRALLGKQFPGVRFSGGQTH